MPAPGRALRGAGSRGCGPRSGGSPRIRWCSCGWWPRLAEECAAAARLELAGVDRGWGVPSEEELTHSTVIHELMVTLGIAKPAAERLLELATRLVTVLPDTLAALEAGRIDLPRAEMLSQETELLDDASARAVQALVLQRWPTRTGRGRPCRRGHGSPRSNGP